MILRKMLVDPLRAGSVRGILLAVIASTSWADKASGQLFTSPMVGAGATGIGTSAEKAGQLTGRERFLRRNRRRTAFVGRDSRERTTFVGQQQGSATGRVQTAVASQPAVRFERNANLSSQRTNQSTSGIYEPRLAVGFSFEPAAPEVLSERLTQSLNALPRFRRAGPLSVTVDARTATLRGVVASTEDRQLAEVVVGFEPGVSKVVNQLTVVAN